MSNTVSFEYICRSCGKKVMISCTEEQAEVLKQVQETKKFWYPEEGCRDKVHYVHDNLQMLARYSLCVRHAWVYCRNYRWMRDVLKSVTWTTVDFIVDKKNLLTPEQKQMLEDTLDVKFMLGGLSSLKRVLDMLDLVVVIEPGLPTENLKDFWDKAERYWTVHKRASNEPRFIDERIIPDGMDGRVKDWLALDDCDRVKRWRSAMGKDVALRGVYDPHRNTIRLFPEAMKAEYNGEKTDELLKATLVREIIRAYFSRMDFEMRKLYPYARFVEDPMADFGTLLFYHETQNADYEWCLKDVVSKNSFSCYGAILMMQYLNGDGYLRECLEKYRIKLDESETFGTFDGKFKFPKSVIVDHKAIFPRWSYAEKGNPGPKFFWDKATRTLGLDDDWNGYDWRQAKCHNADGEQTSGKEKAGAPDKKKNPVEYLFDNKAEYLYIGDSFVLDNNAMLYKDIEETKSGKVTVSASNAKASELGAVFSIKIG